MALPNPSLIKTAIENLFAAIAEDPTVEGSREAASNLWALQRNLNVIYPVADVALTADSTDADVAAFLAGDGSGLVVAGGVFRTTTATFDLTDNALATAKGSAVAINDVYAVTDAGTGVVFMGADGDRTFDFSGEAPSDFEA